jgi:hypothetical protein
VEKTYVTVIIAKQLKPQTARKAVANVYVPERSFQPSFQKGIHVFEPETGYHFGGFKDFTTHIWHVRMAGLSGINALPALPQFFNWLQIQNLTRSKS